LSQQIPTLNAFNQSVRREPAYTAAIIAKDIPNPVCFREGFMVVGEETALSFPARRNLRREVEHPLVVPFRKMGFEEVGRAMV
jgi:hypothetical protein